MIELIFGAFAIIDPIMCSRLLFGINMKELCDPSVHKDTSVYSESNTIACLNSWCDFSVCDIRQV